MRLFASCVVAGATLVVSAPAQASWQVAKSRHFIIYADDNPRRVADFAARLEKFDQAARILLQMDDPQVGDGNRVIVFVLPISAVQRLAGNDKFVGGFYIGRASGSLAYIGRPVAGGQELGDQPVLYHEYAHHLMMQQLDQPYPQWFVEGFAEFLANPVFGKDGSVGLGTAAVKRARGLIYGRQMPLDQMLGESYGEINKLPSEMRESIYGRGWLLTHYLFMEPRREGQLNRYILAIANGTPKLQAAQAAFGDLGQLQKELDAYLNRTLYYFKVPPGRIRPVAVDVQPLSQGAAQVIQLRARVKKGVPPAEREALAGEVRAVEAKFPGDALVEATLAEAELDAQHAPAAEAAADRAIAADPKSAEPLVLKGRAIENRALALDPAQRSALFAQARKIFIAANKLDLEDPEPLMNYYRAYLEEGVRPTDNAIAALHYASNLAPQDLGLRMNSAVAYLNERKLKEARATLIPVAYSPHAARMAEAARAMIARIDAGDDQAALAASRRPSDGATAP
jgi:hypothetical protein